jgi:hypothetical protein
MDDPRYWDTLVRYKRCGLAWASIDSEPVAPQMK